ncbi:MAG: cytochrome c [Bdellovibrionales bacterium]|nr:cytochrome c [Bdellovibrionales bacterium]
MKGRIVKSTAYFAGLVLLALAACDRQSKPLAGREGTRPGAPQYTVVAREAATAGPVMIPAVMPGGAAPVKSGEELFAQYCSACHQVTGKGVPGVFPPLDGSPYVLGDVHRMGSIMLYGLQGEISVLGTTYNNVMAPLGPQMSDEELAAVATYVRSAWSNSVSEPVEPSVFKELREKWGQRGMFTIEELNTAFNLS